MTTMNPNFENGHFRGLASFLLSSIGIRILHNTFVKLLYIAKQQRVSLTPFLVTK